MHINCDMGEGLDSSNLLQDKQFMPYINACNIAVGGHAGNHNSMLQTSKLAINHKLEIGAHPSYSDKTNFGRIAMQMSSTELINELKNQISGLQSILAEQGQSLTHIKAHGALYNRMMNDEQLALTFFTTLVELQITEPSYCIPNSLFSKLAKREGYQIKEEGFADRNYNNDGTLVSRKLPNALITDSSQALEHALRIWEDHEVLSVTGDKIPLKVQTICVHSDTPNALEIAKRLHSKFN